MPPPSRMMSRHAGRCADGRERLRYGVGILRKERFDGTLARHQTEHDVAPVGIDAAAPTAAAHHIDALGLAEVEVHLMAGHLVAAHDDGGVEHPRKEIMVFGKGGRQILFGSQIERRPLAAEAIRQHHMAGRKMLPVWRQDMFSRCFHIKIKKRAPMCAPLTPPKVAIIFRIAPAKRLKKTIVNL